MKLVVGLLVAAGLALTACSGGPPVRTVEVTVHHSQFSVGELRVRPGETVRFVVRYTDPIAHELIVGDESVPHHPAIGTDPHHGDRAGEVSVAPGATAVTTYRFAKAGSPILFGCHLPGHWAYGMQGVIRVG